MGILITICFILLFIIFAILFIAFCSSSPRDPQDDEDQAKYIAEWYKKRQEEKNQVYDHE